MTRRGMLLGALALALAIGGAVAGGPPAAGAQIGTPTTETSGQAGQEPGTGTGTGGFTDQAASEPASAYRAFLEDLALNLGLSDPDQIDGAIRTTLKQRVDGRQAAGELSADDAEALKARIDAAAVPLGFGDDGHGPAGGARGDIGNRARGREHHGGPDGGFGDRRDRADGPGGASRDRAGGRGDEVDKVDETPISGLPDAPADATEAADETGPEAPAGEATPTLSTFGPMTAV